MLARLLFNERRRRTVLLLAHLLLLHGGARLLRLLPALLQLAQATLRQVTSQVDLHRCFLHDCFSFISRYIMLNGMLQCLALALDAGFHLSSELLIYFEILDLQLAISLFLCIDKLRRHVEFNLRVVDFLGLGHYRIWALMCQVRNAFVQLFADARLLLSDFRVVGELSGLRDCDMVLQRGLAVVHGRGRPSQFIMDQTLMLQLTLLSGYVRSAQRPAQNVGRRIALLHALIHIRV